MADWSELPYDVIVSIANQLLDIGDFVVFSSVCHYWRLVYLNQDWKPHQRIPWLVLSEYYDNEHHIIKRQFFSLSRFKIYNLPLPEASGSKCWGTSHRWIVAFGQDSTIRLLDPISRASINLPPNSMLMNNTDWFSSVQKAIVLKLRDKFIAMIIYKHNRALAFSKHGDSNWTVVKFPIIVHPLHVVCFKDQILAITMLGTLMLLDIDGPEEPRALFVASPPENEEGWCNIYLVESRDDLLLVFCYRHGYTFNVYKLDILKRKWIRLDELGDAVLLVDDYGCISVSAYEYLKPNSIYFVKDNTDSLIDFRRQRKAQYMIVYNIKDETTEGFWISDGSLKYTCPVWMVPRLW